MALALKFEEGGKYTYYGDEYNLNDLRLLVYSTLDSFISSIKYGKKNREEIYKAVDNLMNGLSTGRVTVGDNRLHDSEGEYRNADKAKRDAYGMATAHILLCMAQGIPAEKEKKEEKKPYTPDVAGRWINQLLFNTESPTSLQISVFTKIDTPENGVWSNINRTQAIAPLLLKLYELFDTISLDYEISPEDKTRLLAYIQLAINDAKSGNVFSENEYHNLYNALGTGSNWSNYFITETPAQKRLVNGKEIPDDYIEVITNRGNFYVNPNYWKEENLPEIFNVFIQGLYGDDTVKDSDVYEPLPDIQTLDNNTLNQIYEALKNEKVEDLISEVRAMVTSNPTSIIDDFSNVLIQKGMDSEKARNIIFNCILQYLTSHNDIEGDGNYSIFPDITATNNKEAILYYDATNNKLYWTSKRKSKAFQDEALAAFQNAIQSTNQNIILGYKFGGILKFGSGNKVLKGLDVPEGLPENGYIGNIFGENFNQENNFNTLLENSDKIAWQLKPEERYRNNPINGGKSVEPVLRDSIYITNKKVPGNNEYDIEKGGKAVLVQPWWNLWTNLLEKNKKIAFNWAKRYALLETANGNDTRHFTSWFGLDNDTDFSNYDWDSLTEDKFDLDKFANYVNPNPNNTNGYKLWTDFVNGAGHDFYKGNVAYIDNNGTREYYDYNNIPDGYFLSNKFDNEHTPLINEYLLTRSAVPEETSDEKTETEGTRAETPDEETDIFGDTNLITPKQVNTWFSDLFPGAIAAGRLLGTLHNNNRAYKALDRSLKPVLKNTYELYSPVTGEFGLMLNYNLQAANVNRLANRTASSDAALNIASRLDANRQANQLQEKGLLLDNQEIKRTAEEALKRQESNVERRTDVANFNRASINETNQEKAKLKAAHITQNWGAIDNYLSGVEKRMRTKNQEKEDFLKDFIAKTTATNVQNQIEQTLSPYQLKMYDWMSKPGNEDKSITEWRGYYPLLSLQRELGNYGTNTVYSAVAGAYGFPYNYSGNINDIVSRYASRIKSARKGAKLIKRKRR